MREQFKQAFRGHGHSHINGIGTPRKTMRVEGAQSFSGEESKLRIEKTSSRVSNTIVALLGNSAPPKSSI